VFMLLTGFGIGAYEGVTDVLLLELHESRKSLFVNLNHFFVTLGSLVITVYLIFLNLSWRSSMVQAALVLIVLTFLYGITALPESEGRKDSGPGDAASKTPLELLRRPALGLLLVSIIAAVGIELGTIGILTSYLVELRGFTEVSSKVALILFLGGFGLGRITLAAVIRDDDVELWIVTLLGASAVTTLLLYAVQPVWLLLTVSALSGLSVSVILPSIITAAAKQFPDQAGTAIGIIKMGIPVGGMVVPLLVSILTTVFSLQVALLVFPVVAAIGIGAVLAVIRTNLRSLAI
jgi:fucose permease